MSLSGASGGLDSLPRHSPAIRIRRLLILYLLRDSCSIHIDRQKRLAKSRVGGIDGVHVGDGGLEGRDVNLIKVEAPDGVVAALDAGEAVDAEIRGGLDVFPGDRGDVLHEGV